MDHFERLNHDLFMREALREAQAALERGDNPIGAVVVHDGQVIGRGRNTVLSSRSKIAHAELAAILSCGADFEGRARESVLYTTVEPCIMCLGVIVMANIRAIVFGAADDQTDVDAALKHVEYLRKRVQHYVGGILERQCVSLLNSHADRAMDETLRRQKLSQQ